MLGLVENLVSGLLFHLVSDIFVEYSGLPGVSVPKPAILVSNAMYVCTRQEGIYTRTFLFFSLPVSDPVSLLAVVMAFASVLEPAMNWCHLSLLSLQQTLEHQFLRLFRI